MYNADIKPGLFYKGVDSTELFSVSCILVMSVVSFPLLIHPYVSMGIVAQMGQLPARVDNDKSYILVDYNHWKAQTSTSVLL